MTPSRLKPREAELETTTASNRCGQPRKLTVLSQGLRSLLALRYSVSVSGLEAIPRRGVTGILFLANHPALIDPVLLMSQLLKRFQPRPLADQDQIGTPLLRWLTHPVRPITLPPPGRQRTPRRTRAALNEVINSLKRGEDILFYPSGRLTRNGRETLGTNSGVEQVLRAIPTLQIVKVRTSGLWGSSFGWSSGTRPSLLRRLPLYCRALLAGGLLFMPRRQVTITLEEDLALGQLADRRAINAHLETFYNEPLEKLTQTPYMRCQPVVPGGQPRI